MPNINVLGAASNAAQDLSFNSQLAGITKQQQADMLFAADQQNKIARTNTQAKMMEAGPKAMKDLVSG
jgi:alkylhydroperoxidase family enzyme